MPFPESPRNRVWRLLIVVSFALALVVGGYTLVLSRRQADSTADALHRSQVSSCEGAKAAREQWSYTLDQLAAELPSRGQNPSFIRFHDRTLARYEAREQKVCGLVRRGS
jgi:hypothetical protein